MNYLCYGRSGSGKSYAVMQRIRTNLLDGKKVFLMVPDQDSMNTERRMTEQLADVPTCNLEIMNFTRLSNFIFRQYGGLTRRYLTNGGKRIFLSMALQQAAPALVSYKKLDLSDSGMLDGFLAMIDEFRAYRILPALLEKTAAELCQTDEHETKYLGEKLSDFALIYSTYLSLTNEMFSDASSDLEETLNLLIENDFFSGTCVYFDGYYGFTPLQYAIISEIVRQTDMVTFTLSCLPDDAQTTKMLTRICDTEKTVKKLLAKAKRTYETQEFHENRRTHTPAISYLAEQMWNEQDTKTQLPMDKVHLYVSSTIHAEVDFLCRDILKQVRGGLRFRDITVVSRDVSRYEGILDEAFCRYDIPFYFAARDALSEKSLFRFLYALIDCCRYHMRADDVLSLLKTGYLSLDTDAIGTFENYVLQWSISGKRFYEEEPWTMNPDGFVADCSESALAVLESVNETKSYLQTTLFPLFEKFEKKQEGMTAASVTRDLISFLIEVGIPDKIQEKAAFYDSLGDAHTRDTTAKLWDVFCGVCDELILIVRERELTLADYALLLDMLVSDTDIGSIPSTADCVTFGDAALLRPENCRHMYIIGLNDGSFPMDVSENAFFSDHEKKVLRDMDVLLSPDTAQAVSDELFYFYYAFTCAADEVTLTRYLSSLSGDKYEPSVAFERIRLRSGLAPIETAKTDAIDTIEGKRESILQYGLYRGTPIGTAMERYYSADADSSLYGKMIQTADARIIETKHTVSSENAEKSLRRNANTVKMSPSRLEKYALCPFSYFCNYAVGLKKQDKGKFSPGDTGTFMHYILQRFVKLYAQTTDKTIFTKKFLSDTVDTYIHDYLSDVSRGDIGIASSKRLRALFSRVKRTAILLLNNLIVEFSASDFVPAEFEMPIGVKANPPVDGYRVVLEDGTVLSLGGVVDRVDTWEKNGKAYIRIIDYKTGSKEFKLNEIALGLNMQMLIYLFAIWQNGETHFEHETVPAGILYVSAKTPEISGFFGMDAEEMQKQFDKSFKRNGLLLDDKDCIAAMDREKTGRYIPVRVKKDGDYYSDSMKSLASLEQFGKIAATLEATAKKLTTEMRAGTADAVPICKREKEIDQNPCTWCDMKPICRAHIR